MRRDGLSRSSSAIQVSSIRSWMMISTRNSAKATIEEIRVSSEDQDLFFKLYHWLWSGDQL
ncbi:transcription regulator [Zea mays]|uniref:Transcription regulator n=1 Tax=Zea mays TaxID=4577 RepID=A0A1D6GM09_MAIZE|nr:transcription regulator [Zea mays]